MVKLVLIMIVILLILLPHNKSGGYGDSSTGYGNYGQTSSSYDSNSSSSSYDNSAWQPVYQSSTISECYYDKPHNNPYNKRGIYVVNNNSGTKTYDLDPNKKSGKSRRKNWNGVTPAPVSGDCAYFRKGINLGKKKQEWDYYCQQNSDPFGGNVDPWLQK